MNQLNFKQNLKKNTPHVTILGSSRVGPIKTALLIQVTAVERVLRKNECLINSTQQY